MDPELQRRQREARAALALLDKPRSEGTEPQAGLNPEQLFASLSGWVDRFMTAVEIASTSHDLATGESDLTASLRELIDLDATARVTARRRPWLATWQTADRVLASAEDVARSYLSALSAETPLAAQQAAAEGQVALDRAADEATALTVRLERADRIADSPSMTGTLANLAREGYDLAGAGDVLALDEVGHELFEQVAGSSACPVGIGATLALSDLLVDATLNRGRFWESVKDTFEALTAAPARLQALLDAPTWLDDFSDATERLFDSVVAQQAVAAVSTRDRDHLRAAMTMAQDLLEGPAKRYVSTILAVRKARPYEKLRHRDAGALLDQAVDAGLGPLLEGLDRGLRHARAHESFQIKNDMIIINKKGKPAESLSLDELMDAVLAGMESVFAMQIGIVVAATSLGYDIAKLDALAVLEIEAAEKVEFSLALAGWSEVSVDLIDDSVVVEGEPAETLTGGSLRDVAMAVAYLDEEFSAMTLWSRSNGHQLAGPLQPLRQFQAATTELDRGAALMEAGRTWSVNDAPVLAADYARKWSAMQAASLIAASPEVRAQGFRVLRGLAKALQDEKLDSSLMGLQAALRSRDLGLPSTPVEEEALDWLGAWEKRRLTNLFD